MPIRERIRGSTLEIVGFQAGTRGERVLIGHRGTQSGDRWWPNRLNLPGALILPTEKLKPLDLRMADGRPASTGRGRFSQDITTPTDRILGDEFKGSIQRAQKVAPVHELMRYWVDVDEDKIAENKIEVWTQVELAPGHEEVTNGAFYDTQELIDNPPEMLVDGHAYFVELGQFALRAAA